MTSNPPTSKPKASLAAAWRAGWQPPDRRPIADWAADNVVLGGAYAQPGPLRLEKSRHLLFPLECLADDLVRRVNIRGAVQTGKTLVAEVFFQWVLANSPGPFQWTFPVDDDAVEHWRDRIEPTLAGCRANAWLAGKVKPRRDYYRFPHMSLFAAGANLSNLQRKSIRYQVNEEIWAWKPGLPEEAFGRTRAFKDSSKVINSGQAGELEDEWDTIWRAGRQHRWGVRCQGCGELQPLLFFDTAEGGGERDRAGLVWDDVRLPDGRWDIEAASASVRYRCRHCGHEHPDDATTWAAFNDSGEYVCTTPERGGEVVSVEWNALVDGHWAGLVREFLLADASLKLGAPLPMKKFRQKHLAQPWEDTMGEVTPDLPLGTYHKLDPWEEAPDAKRFLTVDYQAGARGDKPHFWFVVRAWSRSGQSRLLDEGRLEHFDDVRRKQEDFGVTDPCVCIDGGYQLSEVARECSRYGWTVLVGDEKETWRHTLKLGRKKIAIERPYSSRSKVDPGVGTKEAGRRFAFRFYWSNPSVKDILANLMAGKGAAWDVPRDVSAHYREQIAGEAKRQVVGRFGQSTWRWVEVGSNHLWDCECMQVVGALASGLLVT